MTPVRDDILLRKIIARLKELREMKNLNQQDVFEDIGIHIARIEAVKSNITVSTLAKLCKYYKISLVEFFKSIE